MDESSDFVGRSGRMADVIARLRRVAGVDTTVLLAGESGTGKELAARFLHDNHPTRRHGPLVCIHCGAIPDTLLESELFGHVRGAFTGAERDRIGKFEQADGGTLFLDEISTMSLAAQVRLLRVLQDLRITRVGTSEARAVNVRVVVASNQDLRQGVEDGTFRLDLYYRISAFPVSLPPLRQRLGDLPLLVECLAGRTAARLGGIAPKRFSPDAMDALSAYAWPGNVRELANVIEYATIFAFERDTAVREDLPEEISGLPPSSASLSGVLLTEEGISFRTAVSHLERELILQSLRLAEGNKARAAALLDLKRTTFLEKLRRLEDEGLVPSTHPARSRLAPSRGAAA